MNTRLGGLGLGGGGLGGGRGGLGGLGGGRGGGGLGLGGGRGAGGEGGGSGGGVRGEARANVKCVSEEHSSPPAAPTRRPCHASTTTPQCVPGVARCAAGRAVHLRFKRRTGQLTRILHAMLPSRAAGEQQPGGTHPAAVERRSGAAPRRRSGSSR